MTETCDMRRCGESIDEARWDALGRRDRAADGQFIYAVVTTGVYCRPSCPARRPNIANVRYFPSAADARAAGFRACKRCRPDAEPGPAPRAEAIAQAMRLIEEQAGERVDFAEIGAAAGFSRHHFHRAFKVETGMTPGAYVKAVRARRAVAAIESGQSVTAAIYEAGYGSSSRFYETGTDGLGLKPSEFGKGGAGARIRFAVGQCWLGAILVAATERGLCMLALGDDADALVRDLQNRFPKAELMGGDPSFDETVAQVVGFVETPHRTLNLPLDVKGTAFQLKVWEALRRIPLGQTATYADIAARIGHPGATRAVANACAGNPVAVAIPCHRVVRTDGSLSGYRWGVARKAALLDREQKA